MTLWAMQAAPLFEPRRIETRWSDLGIKGAQPVRNLWERRDLGRFKGSYAVEVPRHGAVMLKIGRPIAAKAAN